MSSLPLTAVQGLVQIDRIRCAVVLQATAVVVFCENVWNLRSLLKQATNHEGQWAYLREVKVVDHPAIDLKAPKMSRYMIQKKIPIAPDLIALFLRTGQIDVDNNRSN
jgi:hypothetical protein